MSNHARGLWGYSGQTPSGAELTIQATGMGGPSAALVLADLAELGVERVVRVGTCTALDGRAELGELLAVEEALAAGGSITSLGLGVGDTVRPDSELLDNLQSTLGGAARTATVASLDTAPAAVELPEIVAAADLQTATLLAAANQLEIAAAALLIVSQTDAQRLDDDQLEAIAKTGGHAAAKSLSNPRPEG